MVKVKFDNGETVDIVNDRLRIVSGWASVQIKDLQNHVVSAIDLVKAMISYMADGGIILYGHTNTPVGKVIYWDLRKHEETGELGIYIVAQIGTNNEIQDKVWELVKSGTITGFSIGGFGKPMDDVITDADGNTEVVKKVTDIILKEISIVEHPANEKAIIEDYNDLAKGIIEHFSELSKAIQDIEKDTLYLNIELGRDARYRALAEYYSQGVFEKGYDELSKLEKEAIIEIVYDAFKKDKNSGCKSRYYDSSGGHFKGEAGTGERFDNCVKYFKNCEGKSEEAAQKICAAIARRKYGG